MRPLCRAVLSFLTVGLLIGMAWFPMNVVGHWLDSSSYASTFDGPLSPYWGGAIQRWEMLIVQEATRRGLDPDFLAALVWTESSGDPNAIGPAGAVGLLQVMPKEAGFSWRPTQQELLDPSTNLFWGARTLSTVIHQGKGDILNALAAYNGGWEKASYDVPQRFAANVLRDYATAVAQRYGVQGRWVGFFAVWNATAHGPIWVADSERQDVYFYGHSNWVPEGGPLIPFQSPAAVVAQCLDETTGQSYAVGLWLYAPSQNWWVGSDPTYLASAVSTPLAPLAFATPTGTLYPNSTYAPTDTPSATFTPEFSPTPSVIDTPVVTETPTPTETPTASPTSTPTPTVTPQGASTPSQAEYTATPSPTMTPSATPTFAATPTPGVSGTADALVLQDGAELRPGATRWWDPVELLPAGTKVRLLGQDAAYPEWVYVSTLDGKLSGWTKIENLDLQRTLTGLPPITPRPTLTASPTPSPTFTPAPTPTPKPAIACNDEPLFAEAWQINKYNTLEGWTVVIFARGYEGTCSYTYYWDSLDNPIAGPMNESVIFEVKSTKREGDIVGSVIVSDGVETVTVGVFVSSPDNDL
ncbi:MAG: transglycosylase SLT domain-containing protein [Anaerolineae bacterium]|nr:transglycosylase SLT domain-containing protein [Anaerolineae bacterium]